MQSIDKLASEDILTSLKQTFNYESFLDFYKNKNYIDNHKEFVKMNNIEYPLFILNIPETLKTIYPDVSFDIVIKEMNLSKTKYNIIIFTNYSYFIKLELTILLCSHTIYYNWNVEILFAQINYKYETHNFKLSTNSSLLINNELNINLQFNVTLNEIINIIKLNIKETNKIILADFLIYKLYNNRFYNLLEDDKDKKD